VWQSVDVTDSLVSPFAFAIFLSEFEDATSGQVLASWIWELLLVMETHQVPSFEKGSFKQRFIARLRKYGEDHYCVCLLLYPRCRGVWISNLNLGIRKAVSLALSL
jgi:hypothetical protein